MDRRYRHYDQIMTLFAGVLLISNLGAVKLVAFGPILTDGGAVLFPLAYIFGDVLTEVYGYKHTRRAIWMGFFVMLLAVGALTVVRYLPPAPEWQDQKAFEAILGFFPRIVVASLVAYLFGEFVNSYILARMKVKSRGQHLWKRLIGSTLGGQFFDTVIFGLIAFGGLLGAWDMARFVAIGWAFKVGVEVAMLPITCRAVAWLKSQEQEDYYDLETDFSPLGLTLR